MKLSIIVPFYNAENHLDRCIYSLINQGIDFKSYEIILINDGSTDNSIQVAETLLKSQTNITLHNQENIGLGASRNVGIELAKGEYIYFIDADDYLSFNVLAVLLEYLGKFELDLIGFKSLSTRKLDLFELESQDIHKNFEIISGVDFAANSDDFLVMAWWYIVKRDLLMRKNLRFPEGRYLEDGPFTFRLFLETKKMIFLPIEGHRYVKFSNSIMNNENVNHIKKLIDDYSYLIYNLNELKLNISQDNNPKLIGFIKKIQYWSDVNVYMLFYRFIKVNLSVKKINDKLNEFKAIDAYPLKFFIGNVNNSLKHKLITFLFNNRYLFYLCLYPLRALYRLKIIKLP